MKLIQYISIGLVFSIFSCTSDSDSNDKTRSNTHYLKGQITFAPNDEEISEVQIEIIYNEAFLSHPSCNDFHYELESKTNGEFDYSFDSYCNANVKFTLSDSLLNIYNKCYSWEVEDKNGNNFTKSPYHWNTHLETERDRNYDFTVRLQPIVELELILENEHDSIRIDSLKIEELNYFVGPNENIVDLHKLEIYEPNYSGELNLEVYYNNSTTIDTTLNYNYVDDCRIKVDLER